MKRIVNRARFINARFFKTYTVARRNKAGFPAASFLAACFVRLLLLFPKKYFVFFRNIYDDEKMQSSNSLRAVAFLRPTLKHFRFLRWHERKARSTLATHENLFSPKTNFREQICRNRLAVWRQLPKLILAGACVANEPQNAAKLLPFRELKKLRSWFLRIKINYVEKMQSSNSFRAVAFLRP